jgi:hypothetical protein
MMMIMMVMMMMMIVTVRDEGDVNYSDQYGSNK